MIVVTTPTGQIGGQLARLLIDAGEAIRVIARDPERVAPEVRKAAEVVQGSHGDPAVIDTALKGADALFWLVPPAPRAESQEAAYTDFSRPACHAVLRHRVGHVVDLTALGGGTRWWESAGLVTMSLQMNGMFALVGAAQRGVAMPGFMDNMLMQIETIRAEGMIFGPLDPDRKVPLAATRDAAAVAARLLIDRSWTGQKDIPVLGPEDLSFNDVAAIMSDVLGRTIRYQQIPLEAMEAQLRKRGSSEAFITGFVAMMRAKNEGMDNVARRTPETTTPTSFRQWCDEVLKPAVRD
jgi:uncharacterized protein YbjT (DUF2867 family)